METHSSILAWKIPLSQTYIYLFFDYVVRGLLVPQPGIEPETLHWMGSLNHWTTREVPKILVLLSFRCGKQIRR